MTVRFLRPLQLCGKIIRKRFHTSRESSNFFEFDRKNRYKLKSDYTDVPETVKENIIFGYNGLKKELSLFKDEIKEAFLMDPLFICRAGEVDVRWKFDGNEKALEQWIVTCDSDCGEGNSSAKLELTPSGTGLFSGIIDTVPVKDGTRRQSGFCNIRTVDPRKSFFRRDVLPWDVYTHIILRVRGDGRNYMLNLHTKTEFDIFWNDLYNYVLYTRGGPYWQYVKISFSKFLLANRARVQDVQSRVDTSNIVGVSITAADGIPGPFNLEIDFIGVERDEVFMEDFAYEMYHTPHPYYI